MSILSFMLILYIELRPVCVCVRVQPRRSPIAGADAPRPTFLEEIMGRIACLVQACKDGTVGCVYGLLNGMRSIVEALASLFKTSGKERGPHSEF